MNPLAEMKTMINPKKNIAPPIGLIEGISGVQSVHKIMTMIPIIIKTPPIIESGLIKNSPKVTTLNFHECSILTKGML